MAASINVGLEKLKGKTKGGYGRQCGVVEKTEHEHSVSHVTTSIILLLTEKNRCLEIKLHLEKQSFGSISFC
jgi:hypothetical protein